MKRRQKGGHWILFPFRIKPFDFPRRLHHPLLFATFGVHFQFKWHSKYLSTTGVALCARKHMYKNSCLWGTHAYVRVSVNRIQTPAWFASSDKLKIQRDNNEQWFESPVIFDDRYNTALDVSLSHFRHHGGNPEIESFRISISARQIVARMIYACTCSENSRVVMCSVFRRHNPTAAL